MQFESVVVLRDWLSNNRAALRSRVPRLTELPTSIETYETFVLRPEQLTDIWREIAQSLKAMNAPAEVETAAHDLVAEVEAEFKDRDARHHDFAVTHDAMRRTHSRMLALAGKGGVAPVASPNFWRGCAFGILAAVSSGFGAIAAGAACLAVGILAD